MKINSSKNIQSSSFNRARQHMNERACGFITAFRGEYSHKENLRRNKLLEADIKGSGLTYIAAKGGFIENSGTYDEQRVTEDTFCVINNRFPVQDFIDLMVYLCGKYEQESVLITVPVRNKSNKALSVKGYYYTADGSIDMQFDNATVQDADLYFTNIHGKDFVLSSVQEYKTEGYDLQSVYGNVMGHVDFKKLYPKLARKSNPKDTEKLLNDVRKEMMDEIYKNCNSFGLIKYDIPDFFSVETYDAGDSVHIDIKTDGFDYDWLRDISRNLSDKLKELDKKANFEINDDTETISALVSKSALNRHKKVTAGMDIQAASVSRLFTHLLSDKTTFAIIGARDKDTGEIRQDELHSLAVDYNKSHKSGFNKSFGRYEYVDGPFAGQSADEPSIILYNISEDDALDIARELNQESIIYKDNDFFGIVYTDGAPPDNFLERGMSFDAMDDETQEKLAEKFGTMLADKGSWNYEKPQGKKDRFIFTCYIGKPTSWKKGKLITASDLNLGTTYTEVISLSGTRHYGGAYDIGDSDYFSYDELAEFGNAVCDIIDEVIPRTYLSELEVTDTTNVSMSVYSEYYELEEREYFSFDLRRVKTLNDLIRLYAEPLARKFIADFKRDMQDF